MTIRKKDEYPKLYIKASRLSVIINHIYYVIILFSVGLFLGVLFINQYRKSKKIVIKYINTYIDEIKDISKVDSTIVQLKTDIKNNIFLVFILWFAGTTIVGISDSFWNNYSKRILLRIYNSLQCVVTLGKIKGLIFVLLTIYFYKI